MVIKMNEYKSINEVCKMLDITSRTIRYYEELGLISTIRDSKTAPRKLDSNTIVKLKKYAFSDNSDCSLTRSLRSSMMMPKPLK